jgi:hypothetical protein
LKDAYYFSHDSNSKDDPKCVLLIEQLGLEGYGIFWVLVETLRDQPGYRYPLALLPSIARRYNSTTQKVEAVVKGYGLFQFTDDDFFFSQSLIDRMMILEKKRESQRQKALKRWGNDASALPQQCHGNADAMPVKESKVKKSKEKKKDILHSTETVSCSSPPILTLILNTKEEYPITQELINGWNELYPAVDVLQQLKNMKGWLISNPGRRKTKKGILRFVNSWLAKEQDKGQRPQQNNRKLADKSNRSNFEQREYSSDYFDNFYSNTPGKKDGS